MKYLLFFLLLAGCSSNNKLNEALTTEESPDLLKTFSLEGTEFDKFKDSATATVAETKPEEVKPAVLETKKSKKKKDKKAANGKVEVAAPGSLYPTDYPEEYKKYDKKAEPLWATFRPNFNVNEQMVFDVKYFGITAGRIALTTMTLKDIGGKKAYHFHVKMTSAPFYKMIYEVNDYLDSYLDTQKFLPIKYMLVQRETKQDVDDLQLFDNEKMRTFYRYRRLKKKDNSVSNQSDEAHLPRFYQDSFSVLYFLRGLEFNLGDHYEFPIITRGKVWLLKATIATKEEITTAVGKRMAYRVNAVTQYPGVLKSDGEAAFWFSADDKKQLLKFEAKVKLGTIDGVLVEINNG